MKEIILIGSGFMAREYLKVLSNLGKKVIIVGRGLDKLEALKNDYPSFEYHGGGLDTFLSNNHHKANFAINCASISQLKYTTELLINSGIKNILLEKPADLTTQGLIDLEKVSKKHYAKIFIAYNRRFYTSVRTLKKETELDGGISSVHFEFTEWTHTIIPQKYDPETLRKWIISNSSHVIDTVFSLIGLPKSIQALIQGEGKIAWHPSGSIFTGCGVSIKDVPFTYHANWLAPGRWSIEVLTKKRRFYLKPMEKLSVQHIGSVQISEFPLDDQLDIDFKTGLMNQTRAFLNGNIENFVTLSEQIQAIQIYNRIGGY